MIFDDIENAEFYYNLGPNIKRGLQFLKENTNLETLPLGRVEIDGDNIFALVQEYDTKAFDGEMWEAHKKYFDIQYVVKGTELIKVTRIENCTPRTPYNAEGDYWLFQADGNSITVRAGQFVLLAPEDVHQPGIVCGNNTEKIRKIVVKARI
ncbi:YhcH/YjgK/YiaL family protein [Kriegella aquimaris]|uniref:YhcH/YjgK/YiaL family protein n=1 Tax=Kriegella aquimaris TaxID=192904 RepID=A0A1G9QHU7_9FLAO|nr:YhcH/YjgK/YiaL family protein [Kriegella aquimaris]SDM10450.1 YhcH/YjgK/YiaL family protein [Kriegella aquimaris]